MHKALLLAVLVSGCAHAPPWTELTSRHFVLRTDLSPRSARAALTSFELTYTALETLAFASNPPRERISFILFGDEDTFRAMAPRGATGFFMPRQADEPEPQPTIAMFGQFSEATQRRFTHELTHRFMDHQLRTAPPWLEEGIAEYYSTMRLRDDGEIELGLLPNNLLFRTDIVQSMALSARNVDTRVELTTVPPVKELIGEDYETFHRLDHEVANYFASWTLVHMMLHGPRTYRPRFSRYVSDLIEGLSAQDAWQREFGDVDLQKLDDDLRQYIVRLYLDEKLVRTRIPQATVEATQRRLRPDEVHLLFARVRPWDSRESIFAAGRELERARALAGNDASAELCYWDALYSERWRRFDAAEHALDRAVQLDPGNERYWLALAELIARPDRLDRLEVERLDYAAAHLTALATTGESLSFLAHYYTERGDPARGLDYATRAAALLPDCRDCAEMKATLEQLLRRDVAGGLDTVHTQRAID